MQTMRDQLLLPLAAFIAGETSFSLSCLPAYFFFFYIFYHVYYLYTTAYFPSHVLSYFAENNSRLLAASWWLRPI